MVATSSAMEGVSLILIPSTEVPTLFAESGMDNPVFPALLDLTSTHSEFVLQSVTNARPGTPLMAHASLAMLVTLSTVEFALNLPSFLLLMLDARPGMLPKTFALPAPTDSTSMEICVCLSLTNAEIGILLVNVLLATMDTTSSMEFVNSHQPMT